MFIFNKIGLFVFLFLTCHAFASAQADIVVIGNLNNSSSLSKEDVASLYLGKNRLLPDGSKAKLINQKEGASARKEFFTEILDKNEASFMAHWSTIIFTGNGTPPAVLDSNAAVKEFVANHPEAIGYIEKTALDQSVKALFEH